jgi:hypothetical protein
VQSYKGYPLLNTPFSINPDIALIDVRVFDILCEWFESRWKDIAFTNPKHWVVDIKYHNLKKGQVPCTRPFHRDTVGGSPKGDCTYWMWMDNAPTTSFYIGPDTPNAPPIDTPHQEQVDIATWVRYDDSAWHRGTEAQEDCSRLFLRILHCPRVKGVVFPYEVTVT